ncbi:TolC family protein [Terracidiphilus gabretensis]|uniref:TolC family protein n=1 Tax=Terracidiphilus gabretensis TaxID=1577687 RepID=UPI001E561B7D|nr:TolC family protein [Terracidiphilus gabretensis]
MAVLLALAPVSLAAQQGLTWDQVKARFEASNPVLKADADNVAEMKAQEITAYLRPNPQLSMTLDQTYPFGKHYDPNIPGSAYRPLSDALTTGNISYLHEREHKRELRLETAQEGTRITQSQHEDLERNLIFSLRTAFVNTLQAKYVLGLAKNDLEFYDKIIDISQHRFKAGDIAQIDLDRIELQRVQYESELQTALVNLRTAKIQLLQMLNDRTPIDQFDVAGAFDFGDTLQPLETYRDAAAAARPDLQAALQTIQQSQTNHKLAIANGSTDPTFAVDGGANPPLGPYIGANVTIPLRIFDHNQGEKQRTQIDMDRAAQAAEGTRAQVFSDVDTAFELVRSNIALLKPYKEKYNDQATRVRETVSYSYLHGGASLMDFLSAQSDYRQVQLAYAQLVGAYMTAAGQLNLAVGREVIP